jgi:hypothetical protein
MRKQLSFETNAKCHSERSEAESRNLLKKDFSASSRQVGTSVEMTSKSFLKTYSLPILITLGLLTCLTFALSPSEKQQLDNFKVSTLKGLRGVAVSVKIVRDDPDTLSLLKETQLAGIAEMTLQKAGIEILPPSPEVGLYVVLVNVASAGRDGANIAMHVQSSLMQIVNLSRDITIKTEAQTWPSFGQVRFSVVSIAIAKSAVERAVKDQALTFAADFKAANQKQLTAEHAEKNKNEAKQ